MAEALCQPSQLSGSEPGPGDVILPLETGQRLDTLPLGGSAHPQLLSPSHALLSIVCSPCPSLPTRSIFVRQNNVFWWHCKLDCYMGKLV